jgi:signal transduction histidine kinase
MLRALDEVRRVGKTGGASVKGQVALLEELLERVGEPVVAADAGYRVVYVNRAAERVLGAGRWELAGRGLEEVVGGVFDEERAEPRPGWRVEPLEDGWAVIGEVNVQGEDGEALVSRLVEAEQLAAVGQLAAGVAHEIGAPLTAISVAVEYLLKRECGGCGFARRDLEVILQQTRRIAQLSRRLVDLARPGDPMRRLIDFNAVITEGYELVEKQLRKASVEGVLVLDGTLPPVYADPHQLQQVVINLVLNAQRAMAGNGGRLEVRTRRRGKWVALEVADNGPGIQSEDLTRIFLPFYSKSGGTGLGLPLARQIVHRHGGTIEVESSPDQGATFCVQIPIESDG